jgi:hypothetical protein
VATGTGCARRRAPRCSTPPAHSSVRAAWGCMRQIRVCHHPGRDAATAGAESGRSGRAAVRCASINRAINDLGLKSPISPRAAARSAAAQRLHRLFRR